ncbi:D-ribose pyranase [Tissierella sp. Yu-01]|uniref:D-ribose pyranase n=1 Tax=Tissierella sp. Yu-01 TaxID=3035694 RepID=UPI00240CE980|nr:D-ribose pyranase [Tissierella sp. Yu-01]WFA10402.1 D-ribose pyranase [Tissierella sp. Yu-01]
MKKIGLLHGDLSKLIAEMAHNDTILIGDAGMPVPKGVQLIDLAVVNGVPSFFQVLKAILSELSVEEGFIDTEMNEVSPHMRKELEEVLNGQFKLNEIPHEELKELSKGCKAVIRTGEFTPYTNIILKSGVLF